MLSKAHRLTKKKDFDEVFKKGKNLKGDFLLCKILKNNSNATRVGFVVSKKVSGKATVRNTVKRRMRAAALQQLQKSERSADMIIIALPAAKSKEFTDFQGEVAGFFKN